MCTQTHVTRLASCPKNISSLPDLAQKYILLESLLPLEQKDTNYLIFTKNFSSTSTVVYQSIDINLDQRNVIYNNVIIDLTLGVQEVIKICKSFVSYILLMGCDVLLCQSLIMDLNRQHWKHNCNMNNHSHRSQCNSIDESFSILEDTLGKGTHQTRSSCFQHSHSSW